MRITIQVSCDNAKEAQEAIAKLTREHSTWPEQLDEHDEPVPQGNVERKNVSPGEPAIGKIGSGTKETILNNLEACQDKVVYKEHLKLLWKRGEVKFDGNEYYI